MGVCKRSIGPNSAHSWCDSFSCTIAQSPRLSSMSKYRPPNLRNQPSNGTSGPKKATFGASILPQEVQITPAKDSSTTSSKDSQPLSSTPTAAQARIDRFKAPPPQPYGLASRGDHRLQDSSAAQHEFFDQIVAAHAAGAKTDSVLADLRKLREAILQAGASPFLKEVFLFSVRLAAPAGRYQTFVPCITYLLALALPLVAPEERVELALLLALQMAHGAGDNSAALAVFFAHTDAAAAPRAHQILHAWVRGDFRRWVQLYNLEQDPAMRAVMEGGIAAMLARMASALTAAYFQLARTELERMFLPHGTTAAQFAAAYAPHWDVGETVILRRR